MDEQQKAPSDREGSDPPETKPLSAPPDQQAKVAAAMARLAARAKHHRATPREYVPRWKRFFLSLFRVSSVVAPGAAASYAMPIAHVAQVAPAAPPVAAAATHDSAIGKVETSIQVDQLISIAVLAVPEEALANQTDFVQGAVDLA